MAEQKTSSGNQYQLQQPFGSMVRWDNSVNASNVAYSHNETQATLINKSLDHTLVRTIFFKKGRHVFNIKLKEMGHIGIGIVGTKFNPYTGACLGGGSESYGTWDNVAAYGIPSKHQIINDIKTKKGDIVKVDLNLNDRTFVWEVNGQRITNNIKIAFIGDVAVAADICNKGDTVEIVQYFHDK
eukprot:386713_1